MGISFLTEKKKKKIPDMKKLKLGITRIDKTRLQSRVVENKAITVHQRLSLHAASIYTEGNK